MIPERKQLQKLNNLRSIRNRLKYGRVLLTILVFLLYTICMMYIPNVRAATDLNFSWTANTDSATKYWLFMDGSQLIATITDKTTNKFTYTLEDDLNPHTFLLIAASESGADFSLPSATAIWIPKRPGYPQKFIITLEPTQ